MKSHDELIAEAESRRYSAILEIGMATERYADDPLACISEIKRWIDRVNRASLDIEIFETLKYERQGK